MINETISRQELAGRIDDFLLKRLSPSTTQFPLRRFIPAPSWNRFDLGFKLLFLDAACSLPSTFAERIYADHIAAFTLGDMHEPGSKGKAGIERFTGDFAAILSGLQRDGFDPAKSVVPLASDGSLLNAGHRAACAIKLGLPVVGVETDLEPMIFDHNYFRNRGMSENDLGAAAIRLVTEMPHATIALIWPAAKGRDREIEALIGPLIYRRAVTLSLQGGHNLIAEVYAGSHWMGDPAKDYPGIRRKLMACFSGNDPLRVLIFDAPPERDRVALKDKLRQVHGIAKSSLHMTDTHAEAVTLAHLLLNPNSRHFLDHARPMAFAETRSKVAQLQRFVAEHNLPRGALAADTGMVMGAYGLRPPGDIDVIADRSLPPGPIAQHDGRYLDHSIGDLLQDPEHHFTYFGLKFVSLKDVAALKRNRLAGADRTDLLLIEPLLAGYAKEARPQKFIRQVKFAILRFRRFLIRVSFRLGIGTHLRAAYREWRAR